MLEKLVVVDYLEGAGGEYLSQCINNHNEFQHSTVLQKWFNSQRHIIPNWADVFDPQSKLFLEQCNEKQIKNLAVSYHLCYYPEQIDLMRPLSKDTRFVKIDSVGHEEMVRMDFVRKVLFNRLEKQHIKEVKYRLQDNRNDLAMQLINLLTQGKLYGLDLVLFKFGLPITQENREDTFNKIVYKQVTCPTNDITISYEDFFINFDKLKKSYYTLCNGLNIVPNETIAEEMLIRNKRNLDEVTEFTKNFESIKNTILTTTL